MNKKPETASKKQPWGPFFKQVLGPNVPWAWYILNLVIQMAMSNLFLGMYELSGRIMAGEIFNNELLFQYIGMNVLSLVFSLVIGYSGSMANYWTERKIQNRIWHKMVRMPMRDYDKEEPSTLLSRVINDIGNVTYTLSYIFNVILTAYSLFLMLGTIYQMNSFITLALLCVLPYIFATMVIPGRFLYKAQAAVQQKMANLSGYIAERLSSITLVKSSANEEGDLAIGYEAAEEYYKAYIKYHLIDGATQPFSYGTEGIVGAIVLISGSILVQQGKLDMAGLMTMFAMRQSIYINMLQFIFCFYYLKTTMGSTAKIGDIMTKPSETMQRKQSFTEPDADLAFEDVGFSYVPDEKVLQNVSMIIPKGKVTAIVGPSGAGKTTMLSLLERLYTPDQGKLTYGGQDAEDFHLDQWRRSAGYIQQNSPLLSGTVRDNIVYGMDREATQEEVERAAKMANAYDFIMKLPQGFDTEIGQLGGKLSGGERQRIAIARMIIKDPDYLFLDEATSNLDAENEAAVQAALNTVMEGRTAVVVAHNLRTVVNADNIIVMDQGKVQAVGTHETLYQTSPLYKKYFDLQFAQ